MIVLYTTMNSTYNVNLPRRKLQKHADSNVEIFRPLQSGKGEKLFKLAKFSYNLQAKNIGGVIPSIKIVDQCRYKFYNHDSRKNIYPTFHFNCTSILS